jgi:hypothetical protein
MIVEEGGEGNITTKEEEGKEIIVEGPEKGSDSNDKDSTNNEEVEANGSSSHLYFHSRTAPIGFFMLFIT